MKKHVLLVLFFLLLFHLTNLPAQKNLGYKFEKITLNDFNVSPLRSDSAANAIVLADVGSTDFEGNSNGYFTLIFKQHERILLKNRNAFDEATIKVPLYNYGFSDEEKFLDLEATTYNLVNGQVVETKLDKSSVFKEKLNKYFTTLFILKSLPTIK